MSKIQIIQVGPYAAANATQVAASQKSAGTPLVLNGTGGTFNASNICTSQTPTLGSGVLVLNGSLAYASPPTPPQVLTTGAVAAFLPFNEPIYVTSAGNDSATTFTVTGLQQGPAGLSTITESFLGANVGTASSKNSYFRILSIAFSGAPGNSAVTVGTYTTATVDANQRQLAIASAGNDSGITFAVAGTNQNGDPISETITGGNIATVVSVLDYLTVTSVKPSGAVASTVTVGTNTAGHSPWAIFDEYSGMGTSSIQVDGVPNPGTVNWTVQQTLNDPTAFGSPIAGNPAAMLWVNHPDSNLVSSTVTSGVQGNYAYVPKFARILLTSGTGAVRATFQQAYMK